MECINAFINSNEDYDRDLKTKIKSTIKIRDGDLIPFLTSLKYPLDVYCYKHKEFNRIFKQSITDVKEKLPSTSNSLNEEESFYVNTIDNSTPNIIINNESEDIIEPVEPVDELDIKNIPWDVALRALCETIVNPEWYNRIQSLDEIPLSLVISLKNIKYFTKILPTISETYQIVSKPYGKKSINKVIYHYRINNNLDVKKKKQIDTVSITKSYIRKYNGKTSPYDIDKNLIETISLIYIYSNYRYVTELQRLSKLKSQLADGNKHITLLCNPAFVFSFIMMCLFEKCTITSDHTSVFKDYMDYEGSDNGRDTKEIYVNTQFLECYETHSKTFDLIDNITEEIRNMLISDKLSVIKGFKGINRFITDLNLHEMHQHINDYKEISNTRKWTAMETYSDKIKNLYDLLNHHNMIYERERLKEFFINRNQKHYVFLRFKERVTEYELDMTLRSILVEEPQLKGQEKNYIIMNLSDEAICLVIKIPLLFAIRDVSYSYVFSNPKRITKSVPMYPVYLTMLYTEYAYISNYESSISNNDIALRSVIRVLSTWITKQPNIHQKILHVDDSLFSIYRLLTKLISKWDSVDLIFDDVIESYQSYIFDVQHKGKSEESSLFSALLGFIALREPHHIERDGVEMMNMIFQDEDRKNRLMSVFPSLCVYYQRLKEISDASDTDTINMTKVDMSGIWDDVDKEDKCLMGWVESYILCSSNYLKNSEARFLFCCIRPERMPNARKYFSGKHFQEELSSSMRVYLERFSKPTSVSYYGLRKPVKEASLRSDRKEIVCLMFRMMEWASLHMPNIRGELLNEDINPLGPCNVEVFDLLYSPPLLPVSIRKSNNQVNLVYTDESLFICKMPTSIQIVNNNISSSKNQIANNSIVDVQHYMIDIVFHYYKYICNGIANSRYMNNLDENNPDMLLMDAIHTCSQSYQDDKKRRANRKRKLNWDHYFTREDEEYERARKLRVLNGETLRTSPVKALCKLVSI